MNSCRHTLNQIWWYKLEDIEYTSQVVWINFMLHVHFVEAFFKISFVLLTLTFSFFSFVVLSLLLVSHFVVRLKVHIFTFVTILEILCMKYCGLFTVIYSNYSNSIPNIFALHCDCSFRNKDSIVHFTCEMFYKTLYLVLYFWLLCY